MSLWSSVRKKIKQAAKAVESVVNNVGEAVSDAIESAGNGIEDGLSAVADWVGGGAAGAVINWFGDVISAGFDVVAVGVKAGFSALAGSLSGMILILGGTITGSGSMWLEGLTSIVSPVLGAAMTTIGGGLGVISAIMGTKSRRLTSAEEARLRNVFRDSIAYYNVRIVDDWAGVFSLATRPFTHANTIYLLGRSLAKESELLVHEATHVWQYQHRGPRYASGSYAAQFGGSSHSAYDWRGEFTHGNTHWFQMNVEAQAAFIETAWLEGVVNDATSVPVAAGNGAYFGDLAKGNTRHPVASTSRYDALGEEAIRIIRDDSTWRLSHNFD